MLKITKAIWVVGGGLTTPHPGGGSPNRWGHHLAWAAGRTGACTPPWGQGLPQSMLVCSSDNDNGGNNSCKHNTLEKLKLI